MTLAFLVFLLAQSLAPSPQGAAPSPEAAAKDRVFAITFRTGPAWDAGKKPQDQLHFRDHSESIGRLKAEGRLLIGGRFSDVGLILVRAASEEEARGLLERDQSVKAGTFTAEVHPWSTFAWGCLEKGGAGR